jgi:hypothetical protein
MGNLQTKMTCLAVMDIAAMLPNFALAQSQTPATQIDQPNRVSIVYGQPNNSGAGSRISNTAFACAEVGY